jgi:hypothetical protein
MFIYSFIYVKGKEVFSHFPMCSGMFVDGALAHILAAVDTESAEVYFY